MTFSKLGTDTGTGQFVYLPKTARLQGLYIIGIQGTGKSGLIENLILQDIDQQIGVCVLDPHGELIDHVIARLDPNRVNDVILLTLADYNYPFGLNLFACSDLTNPLEVQKTVDQVLHIFEKLLGVSTDTPLILEYLYNCTYTLVANPGYTMADIPLLLQDEQCRRKLVANVSDIDVLSFWKQHDLKKPSDQNTDISSTLRRVKQFLQPLSRPIVGQSKTTIDLQKIMNDGKILLVKLSAQVDSVSSLIGSLMIALLLNAAYNRPAQRRQFHLYADEFQRFATEDFATLLEEARKFGIATTIAHQNRGQLNSANSKLETDLKDRSRSVGNLVMFKINSKDADDLAGEFDTSPPPPKQEEVGKRKKQVPVTDVIGHLLRVTHKDRIVNDFVRGTLANLTTMEHNLNLPAGGSVAALNSLFSVAMEQHNAAVFFPRIPADVSNSPFCTLLTALRITSYQVLFNKQNHYGFTYNMNQSYDAIELMWRNPLNSPAYLTGKLYLQTKIDELITSSQSVSVIAQMKYEWAQKSWEDFIRRVSQNRFHDESILVSFLEELKWVVQALVTTPILGDSGEEEVITRPGTVRPYQDVKNDIANQLSGLPTFTARVKISVNAPQNLGKTCLNCGKQSRSGALHCGDCGSKLPAPNEYTITTLKPAGGIGAQQLDQRMKQIQARNARDGYTRPRQDVEAEILQRQTRCSGGSSPAQPQRPPQPPHARQVPTCPNCGKSNSLGSKFCNQCGAQL